MKRKIYILTLSLVMTLMTSCFRDEEDTTETVVTPEVPTIIESSAVVINVKDQFGKEIKGLTAKFDNQVKIVNQFSYFHFSASDINKYGELLTITDVNGKSYEFSLHNIENQVNYHDITLYQNIGSTTYHHDNEANIPFERNDFELKMNANTYTLSNAKYSGLVTCQFQTYNCSIETEKNALPGTETITINGKRMFFEQYHALQIEYFSVENKRLEITGNHIVKYTTNNPEIFDVVKYDNTKHSWEYVSKMNSDNTFQISKSGIYAVGKIRELSIVSGSWQVENKKLVKEKLTYQYEGRSFYTYTNNEGGWEILCPLNTQLEITTQDKCIINNEKIKIQTNALEIKTGTKLFQNSLVKNITIVGYFADCQFNSQPGGFLSITVNGQIESIYIPTSQIDFTLTQCAQDVTSLAFISYENQVTWEYIIDKDSLDLGVVFDCRDIKQNYVNLKSGNTNKLITEFVSISDENGMLIMNHEIAENNFILKIKHSELIGAVDPSLANIVWKDKEYNGTGIEISCPSSTFCGFEKVIITAYKKNEYIRGYFKGNFWSKKLVPLSAGYQFVEGHFHVNL